MTGPGIPAAASGATATSRPPDVVASVTPPVRRLRRFEKIALEPGASRTVSFSLAARELSFVGRDDRLVLEPGAFEAIVGTLTAPFQVTSRP